MLVHFKLIKLYMYILEFYKFFIKSYIDKPIKAFKLQYICNLITGSTS